MLSGHMSLFAHMLVTSDQLVDVCPKKTKLNDENAKRSKKAMTLEKAAQINKEKVCFITNYIYNYSYIFLIKYCFMADGLLEKCK